MKRRQEILGFPDFSNKNQLSKILFIHYIQCCCAGLQVRCKQSNGDDLLTPASIWTCRNVFPAACVCLHHNKPQSIYDCGAQTVRAAVQR